MNLRARSVHEAVALQSFRMKANLVGARACSAGSFDHSRHPRAPRSETARLLFRAYGPPCFQVNRSWIRCRGPARQRRIFSRSLLLQYQPGQVPPTPFLASDKPFSEYPTLPANLCPFSWRREVTCFDEDFGEAVGEAVEPNANSVV